MDCRSKRCYHSYQREYAKHTAYGFRLSERMAVGNDRGVAPDFALRAIGEDSKNCLTLEVRNRQCDGRDA